VSGVDDPGRPEGSNPPPERSQQPPRPAPWKLAGAWNIPDVAPEDPYEPGRPYGALVTFHYVRAAVRRRWLRCLLPGLIGLVLAVGFLAVSPPTATTTLLLTRVATNDATSPMATDMSLLTTRAVAQTTIDELGLTMAPEDLLATVHPVPSESSNVLQLTMTGPTAAEAVRRLKQFSQDYLDFRSKTILAQSTALIDDYNARIKGLQKQVSDLDAQIQQLQTGGGVEDNLTDKVAQRSKLTEQIGTFQSQVQDLTLQQDGIKYASRVIDSPAPVPTGGRRHVVMVLVSGLVAGLALGLGLTVMQTLLSDRLWLRAEVASALKTTVPMSVRRLAPPWRLLAPLSFVPWVRTRLSRRSADRQLMAHVIAAAVPGPGRRQSVALLCLGNSGDMGFGVVAAASELRRRGMASTIIDLTVSGRVGAAVGRVTGTVSDERPEVFRPSVVPSLTRGPAELDTADWDDVALAKAKNGVTLVIADFDPAVGVDHLAAWSDRVIVAITAGRSSVELVRTTGELVRVAGLHLQHAVLLKARGDDITSGFVTLSEQEAAEASPRSGEEPDAGSGRSHVQ
jgi:capsular polysaccharide biosynthesis protein